MARKESETPPIVGFLMLAVPSLIALILIILAIGYYPGNKARIGSLYTSMAAPADRAVTADVNAYNRDQRTSLVKAKADLAKLVQADSSFDSSVRATEFPHAAETSLLVNANVARIKLFRQQEKSTTLRQLRSFNGRDQSANAAVATLVQQTRVALGLPATSSQLF